MCVRVHDFSKGHDGLILYSKSFWPHIHAACALLLYLKVLYAQKQPAARRQSQNWVSTMHSLQNVGHPLSHCRLHAPPEEVLYFGARFRCINKGFVLEVGGMAERGTK